MTTKSQAFSLASAAYYKDSTPIAPPGYTVVQHHDLDPSGLQAVAFKNIATGDITISFMGTNPTNLGQLKADADIMNGTIPEANQAGVNFTKQVIDANLGAYFDVVGHSLGGEIAEFVTQQVSAISSGIGFGAPGVPGMANNTDGNFTSYINYGDIVGNYASDTPVGKEMGLQQQGHYGTVIYQGDISKLEQLLAFRAVARQAGSYASYPAATR